MSLADSAETVILVDDDDNPLGVAGKLDAHRRGLRHRAFSIIAVNAVGDLLLQRRAAGKYHSAGLWTNACCGHPRPRETTAAAARRRIGEELGVVAELQPIGRIAYHADLAGGMVENEVAHLFACRLGGRLDPDPAEVSDWRWISPIELTIELARTPGSFTAWFRHYLQVARPLMLDPLRAVA